MTIDPGDQEELDAQRDALTALIALFSADRDSLVSLVQEVDERLRELANRVQAGGGGAAGPQADAPSLRRLAEVETLARSGLEGLAALRDEIDQVRGAVTSLHDALDGKADRADGGEALAGMLRPLEARLESLSMDLWRSISSVDRRLAERGTTLVQEIEQVRGELREGIAGLQERTHSHGTALAQLRDTLPAQVRAFGNELSSLRADLSSLREDVSDTDLRLSAVADIQDDLRRRLESGLLAGLAGWLRAGMAATVAAALGVVPVLARIAAVGLLGPWARRDTDR